MTDCCRHSSHLTVPSFAECQFKPRRRYLFSESDGDGPGGEVGFFLHEPDFCRFCFLPVDHHSFFKGLHGARGRNMFNLYPVRSRMPEAWLEKIMLYGVVVGQEKKALAVGIKSADRIDVGWKGTIVPECALPAIAGELGENPERFIKQEVLEWHCSHGCSSGSNIPDRWAGSKPPFSSEGVTLQTQVMGRVSLAG